MSMSGMGGVKCIVLVVAAAALLLGSGVEAQGEWRWGRATFYGIWWSLHHGSCGYGNIDYWKGTGWDVAAIPDSHYEYQWSCGKCYEVKCEPMNFKDNYGNHLDRSGACYDPHKVVTVTIVDSCPCNYPSNAYSNRRWCCGDMDHFDLSYHTFDKLASRHWGVIGLKYRPVECPGDFRLENKHHLGRKLMDEESKGPQMYIIDERYELSDSNETDIDAVVEPVHISPSKLTEIKLEAVSETVHVFKEDKEIGALNGTHQTDDLVISAGCADGEEKKLDIGDENVSIDRQSEGNQQESKKVNGMVDWDDHDSMVGEGGPDAFFTSEDDTAIARSQYDDREDDYSADSYEAFEVLFEDLQYGDASLPPVQHEPMAYSSVNPSFPPKLLGSGRKTDPKDGAWSSFGNYN